MQSHTKIYINYFGFTIADFIGCEVCGNKATEIHHIDCRGMGGDPQLKKDVIENLMAMCRECHNYYGDKKEFMDKLIQAHLTFMKVYGKNPKSNKF